MKNRIITVQDLATLAPSALATKPHNRVSDKYVFVPTTKVIEDLAKEGWQMTFAAQARTKGAKKYEGFQKHMIRFENFDITDNEYNPQIVLTNAHTGTASFRFYEGMVRFICANMMITMSKDSNEYKINHIGYASEDVAKITQQIVGGVDEKAKIIDNMRGVSLDEEAQRAFAKRVAEKKWADKVVDLDSLLILNRNEDDGEDLWKTFNIVQENVVNGNVRIEGKRGFRRGRPLTGIDSNISTNQLIWETALEFMQPEKVLIENDLPF